VTDPLDESLESPVPDRPQATGAKRYLLLAVGGLSTTLALLGAFLPILPTTPFLLLAMACYLRSSPELNRRLLANRAFGPYLAQWQHDHTVPLTAKRKAYGLVVLSFGLSIWIVDAGWLRLALGFIALGLLVFLARLRTTPRHDV
jgi:uncharacterized protein